MIKKALILLVALAIMVVPTLSAQQKTGRWTVYSTVSTDVSKVAETADKTYFLIAGSLFHLSSVDNEFYAYNSINKLSDASHITNIYYNKSGKYLLLTYENGNIDLLYDNGRMINMPDIKDAVLTTGRQINHVTFSNGKIYVATQFGIVIYDENRHEVIESGVFNTNVDAIFVMGDSLVLIINRYPYIGNVEGKHNTMDKFTQGSRDLWGVEYAPLSDQNIILKNTNNDVLTYNVFTDKFGSSMGKAVGSVYSLDDGAYFLTSTAYVLIDKDGTSRSVAQPAAIKGRVIFPSDLTLSAVWTGTNEGIARYDLSGATPTVLSQPFNIDGFTVANPAIMKYSNDGQRLYVSNLSATFIWQNPGDNYQTPQYLDIVENGKIRDAAVHDAKRFFNQFQTSSYGTQEYMVVNGRLTGVSGVVEDPDDPNMYYLSSNCFGVAVIKNGDVVQVYNKTNTTIPPHWWLCRTLDLNIDRDGNLWFTTAYGEKTETDNNAIYNVLPSAKRKDYATITRADWFVPQKAHAVADIPTRDSKSLFTKKDNLMVMFAGNYGYGLTFYHDGGTFGTNDDDRAKYHSSFTDTEGNTLNPPFYKTFCEDHDGALWIGTNQGLFYIAEPMDALTNNLVVKRPIVPRNDGTNFGDYLLETEDIFKIDVDPSNRKWIATAESGVYLVSADGTEILEHYTTDNSPLPSNTVYALACDPTSNIVYFGTAKGIVSYESDSAPAAADFSEVLVYPNPVRPDFNGWVTISGLMDNSLVKIADTAGNVFFQGTSEGGMIRWDCCTPGGERVRTGVYLVFASSGSGSEASSGVVAKIMVVN